MIIYIHEYKGGLLILLAEGGLIVVNEEHLGRASVPLAKQDKTGTSSGKERNYPIKQFTITRRNLPHYQEPGRTYFITFRVREGEIPIQARQLVLDSCLFWNGKKCKVHACVIMPDHVHILLTPFQKKDEEGFYNLTEILHSIKSYSSHAIQKMMGRSGIFWLVETFDRMIRSEEDFSEKWGYIRNNPVKNGLVENVEDYPYMYEENREDNHLNNTGGTPVLPAD